MKRTLVLVLFLTALLGISGSWAVTINVPGDYSTIQDAINAASPTGGDVIQVDDGTYTATSLASIIIDRSLTLIGTSRDGTIIDAGTWGTDSSGWPRGIQIKANNVTIKNLTIQGFTGDMVNTGGYGIVFRDWDHDEVAEGLIYYTGGVVDNIKIQNSYSALYALVHTYLTVNNCLIQNNYSDGMFIARWSDYATITNNQVTNSGNHGIWVGKDWTPTGPSGNATITGNVINGANEGGISFYDSNTAVISGNTISNVFGGGWSNGAISFMGGGSNITIDSNTIFDCDITGCPGGYLPAAGAGIGMAGTMNNIAITNNTIYNNEGGGVVCSASVSAFVSNNNKIYDNTGYGVNNTSASVLDFRKTWWGDPSGPYHASTNTDGSGNTVSNNVTFDPWWADSALSTLGSNYPVINVTQAIGYNTIQAAIDAAMAGDVIQVAAGTYNENVVVPIRLTLNGLDSNVIINGSGGIVLQMAAGTDAVNRSVAKNLKLTGGTTGITVGSYTTLENIVADGNINHGINLNPLTDLIIDGCSFINSATGLGLKLASTASASYITITNSHFDNNYQGWYSDASSAALPDLDHLTISYTTFNNNTIKGFYTERLSNALFDHVTVSGSGNLGTYAWGAGFDINLKWKAYSNITIQNSSFTNCGLNSQNGVGLTIKGRDDGSYASPAASVGIVVLSNNTITGNERGLRFGEPGKNNATPTNVSITGCTINSNMKTYTGTDGSPYGDVINATTSTSISLDGNVLPMGAVWNVVPGNSLQATINAAAAGDVIYVANGTYPVTSTLYVNKALTIIGESEAGAIIDRSTGGGYGIDIQADDVTMKNFTILPNSDTSYGYTIKASFDLTLTQPHENLTLDNITINGSQKTAFDIHGYNNVELTNLTATNTIGGVGIALTGCDGATLTGVSTSGNAWGGIAAYVSKPEYLNRGSNNININYTQNSITDLFYSQDESGLVNTNINVTGYTYGIGGGGYFTYTTLDLATALATAATNGGPISFVWAAADPIQNYYVGPGMTIQAAIDAANPGNTITVAAGEYVEVGQILIDKDLSIIGAGKAITTVKTAQSTGPNGDDRGWILVPADVDLYLSGLTLDGAGYSIQQGIRVKGYLNIQNCAVKNIAESRYIGYGIVIMGNENMVISGNEFSGIARMCVWLYGPGITDGLISGNTFTGKGEGDYLDYPVWISAGASATITGNTITNCRGISNDGYDSAAIALQSDGSNAVITGNNINNNTIGVSIGSVETSDLAAASLSENNFANNVIQVQHWGLTPIDMGPVLANNDYDRAVLVLKQNYEAIIGNGSVLYVEAPKALILGGEEQTYTAYASYVDDLRGFEVYIKVLKSMFASPHTFVIGSEFSNSTNYPDAYIFDTFDYSDETYWNIMVSGAYNSAHDGITDPDVALFTFKMSSLATASAPAGTLVDIVAGERALLDENNAEIIVYDTLGKTIYIDSTAPEPIVWEPGVTTLLNACRTSINANNSIDLMWSNPTDAYKNHIWRLDYAAITGSNAYPTYNPRTYVPAIPALDPTLPSPQNGWTLLETIDAATTYTDTDFAAGEAGRGYYYYAIYAQDLAGNISGHPAEGLFYRESLSYWPGDFNIVDSEGTVVDNDVSFLTACWGLYDTHEDWLDVYEKIDVGPSTDFGRRSRPCPDGRINIEDMMMFAMNYYNTNYSVYTRDAEETGPEPVSIAADRITSGNQLRVELRLEGNQEHVRGLDLPLHYGSGLALQSVSATELWPENSLLLHTNAEGIVTVSAAAFGAEGVISGNGVVAVLVFDIVGDDLALQLGEMTARTVANLDIEVSETLGNTSTEDLVNPIPEVSFLGANYPNPFNPRTTIPFGLKEAGEVSVRIYNNRGQLVKTLVSENKAAGTYQLVWDGRDDQGQPVSSGMYLIRMVSKDLIQTRKALLMK